MRMSVKKNDSGYHKRAAFYNVLLDGERLDGCYTADEDRGYVLIYKRNNEGQILVNKGETIPQKIYGKVEIVKELKQ